MRRAYFFAYSGAPPANGTGWAIFPWADLGFWPRCSHSGMHILLASLIITGAMCDIVDLEKWESNDAPHDVHQSCRARVDH